MIEETQLQRTLSQGIFTVTCEITPPRGVETKSITKIADVLKGKVSAVNVNDNPNSNVRVSSLVYSKLLLDSGLEPILEQSMRDRNRIALQSDLILFDEYENPMPITFGKLHAGDWPATIPKLATLEGVLGFLPNKTRFQIMEEIKNEIENKGSDELKANFDLEFMYRHDAHVLPVEHELVKTLEISCKKAGLSPEISAMVASCDSWFYNNQLEIPTLVFGSGELAVAHSDHEHIKIADIEMAARVLLNFLSEWCKKT